MRARYWPWVAAATAVVFVAGLLGAAVVALSGPPTRTISAQFSAVPGLYAGNNVDVLGISVGRVTAIHPGPDYVTVVMAIDKSVKLPAGAKAVLMAPEVVSDRFIQIGPAYVGGPAMPPGTVIPLQDTAIPQSVDAVIGTLNQLAIELGPNGANRTGALSTLVHQLAVELGPNGQDFHDAIVNFSQALGALSVTAANGQPALAGTISNLGQLSQALADNSAQYQSLATNLASVSQVLANDRQDVSNTLDSLQTLLANLESFINTDGANLGASITNLKTFAGALVADQAALAQAYSLAPLSLQNLDNTIDKNAAGGPAITGRYDPVASTGGLFDQVCGAASLRFLVLLASGTQTNPLTPATPTDTLCGIGTGLVALPTPPGAPSGPDLSLSALVPGS